MDSVSIIWVSYIFRYIFQNKLALALVERQVTVMDNLDKTERSGWIPNADEWQAIRLLRNQMVHEYIEDLDILTSAIQSAQLFVPMLNDVANKLLTELKKRGWVE